MPLATSITFNFRDQKNKKSRAVIRIPSTVTITNAQNFATDAAQLLANASTGQITGAEVTFSLDLSTGLLPAIVSTFASVTEKALFSFRSAVGGLFKRMLIPTLDETDAVSAGTDLVDLTDPEIAAFIAATEDGVTITTGALVVQPKDKYGNDLVSTSVAREIFQSQG